MCLEWLVVRPLASIKPTAELLLVMPDILTALRGAGAGADTRVFEVKHTVRISHSRLHKCTHADYCAVSRDSVSDSTSDEGTVEQTKD